MGLPQFSAIAVADLQMAEWYAQTFDLELAEPFTAPDGSQVTIVRGESLLVELKQRAIHVSRVDGADSFFKMGWFVSSLDDETARLAAKGVEAATAVIDQPEFGVRFVLIADPEGNLIQLFEAM